RGSLSSCRTWLLGYWSKMVAVQHVLSALATMSTVYNTTPADDASIQAHHHPSSLHSSTVYFLRHGEKPLNGANGLSLQGQRRAECIKDLFGPSSERNVGYILAQKPRPDGRRSRPLKTVAPLADALGLSIDTDCEREDEQCVEKKIRRFTSKKHPKGNVLVCWEHRAMTDIAREVGVKHLPEYPDDRYDLIWVATGKTIKIEHEHCPVIDTVL
ncbi:uncharacterized protein L969DRAFT_54006, partial [Mixia osmundae IAM 14324]